MTASTLAAYEAVPYPSRPIELTHPDRMGVTARLFGLRPSPAAACRVLELGCASGGNLIPMAAGLPGSEFLGVDLSPRQIRAGRARIAALGLTNVTLSPVDITKIDEGFGRFDYIVCHGVYSWVPAPVRAKILAVLRENLEPGGVAYVSYNVLPGSHALNMLRQMMLYHVGATADPAERAAKALELVEFLHRTHEGSGSAYAALLGEELKILQNVPPGYLDHEYLEPDNHAFYFHEFMRDARFAGLSYLAEADLPTMLPENFAPEVRSKLEAIGDTERREQYMDFAWNRRFRMTLLCRDGAPLRRAVDPTAIAELSIRATAVAERARDHSAADAPASFVSPTGRRATLAASTLRSALEVLVERAPAALTVDTLLEALRARAAAAPPSRQASPAGDARAELEQGLMRLHFTGLVALHAVTPPLCTELSARPTASPLARLDARVGSATANAWHQSVGLDAEMKSLLPLLDGHHDLAAIAAALPARGGAAGEGTALRDAARTAGLLQQIARLGLLVG